MLYGGHALALTIRGFWPKMSPSGNYALPVVKNGYLIAEKYFDEGSVEQKNELQSATKSVTSALVGVALEQGYLSSVDQKMIESFPAFSGQVDHPRKEQITIRDMLQMRSGYPKPQIRSGNNTMTSHGNTDRRSSGWWASSPVPCRRSDGQFSVTFWPVYSLRGSV